MKPATSKTTERTLDWPQLLETALTQPGSVGDTYQRFWSYSFLNCIYLMMQRCEGPIATYSRWQALGRQVVKGSKAYEIVRPITIKREDEATGEEHVFTRFKPVRCIFSYNQTEGDPLPPAPEPPTWSYEEAKQHLDIHEVPFNALEGNMQGYSYQREIAINPLARFPQKTRLHEMGHVLLGHTVPPAEGEYRPHQGLREWQAESVAYLAGNELGLLDDEAATVSRGYVQGWMAGEQPSDIAIRQVFGATDKILRAGRVAIEGGEDV